MDKDDGTRDDIKLHVMDEHTFNYRSYCYDDKRKTELDMQFFWLEFRGWEESGVYGVTFLLNLVLFNFYKLNI